MDSSYTTVKVLYDLKYETKGKYYVSIIEGEKLFLLEKSNNDWWKVKRNSDQPFYVPSNYVKEIPQAPARPSLSKMENNILKPIVRERTVFEIPLHPTSKNFSLKNNTDRNNNEDSNFEKAVSDTNQVDIQNSKKALSPASNHKNKTVITIDRDIFGYCILTPQNNDINKEQRALLSSGFLEEFPGQIEVNSTPNKNKNDTTQLKTLGSLEELAQQNKLKLMPFDEIASASVSELNTVLKFTEVKNLQENVNKPSLVSIGNSKGVKKLNRKNKLDQTGSFKTKHERNQWAKNMINGNHIKENNLSDKE